MTRIWRLTGNDWDADVRYRFLIRPFIVYVPPAAGLALWTWSAAAFPAVMKLGLIGLGLLVWTLIEYLLHRFVLHARPQTPAFLKTLERLHLGHHHNPQDEAKITVPVSGSWPIAGGLLGLFRLLTGSWEMAALLMIGSIIGYLSYEAVHFWIHCASGDGRWLRQQRANHLDHHFRDRHSCFGVTTPLWDLVGGTRRVR